jgi:hypothetical protein
MKNDKIYRLLKLILVFAMGGAMNSHAIELETISDVRIRFFIQTSGEFSRPLDGTEVLWNVVAGGGDVTGPTSSASIDVVVTGPSKSWKVGRVVTLIVKNDQTGRVLSRMHSRLGVAGPSGESHVGFWLTEIGCEPLELIAQVGGSSRTRKLPLQCGE